MTEITKLKISYALRNRPKDALHSAHIAESLRGKEKSQEHKEAIAEAMRKHWAQRRKVTTCQGDKTCKIAHLITEQI